MSEPWPYASVTDPAWLSSADDPFLTAARDAVRGQLPKTSGPVTAEHLLQAMTTASELRDRLEWVLLSLVGEGRAAGLTWEQVANALGVRKQAAHQRFAPYVAEALARARETPLSQTE